MRLNNNTTNNHLTKDSMQSLISEDKIQLADILEHAIQRLDKYLNQIDQSERGLGRRRDHDKRQRCVGPVCDLRGGIGGPGGGGASALREERREWEEVTGTCWTLRD